MKDKVIAYWSSISKREQQGAIVVAIVVVLTVFYLGAINPILSRANAAKQALKNEKELANWVSNKVSQIRELQAQGGGSSAQFSSMPISQAVTSSVSNFNLQIIRLQPQQEDLQVWLQPMPFSSLLRWIDELEKRYAITVKSIEVDKGGASGNVEVKRLQLGRG